MLNLPVLPFLLNSIPLGLLVILASLILHTMFAMLELPKDLYNYIMLPNSLKGSFLGRSFLERNLLGIKVPFEKN